MSRRAQRRKSKKAGRVRGSGGGVLRRWMPRALAMLAFGSILAGFGLYSWVKTYLHSDEFRVFIGDAVGGEINADAKFELFEWQGMHARTEGFSAENGGVIRQMRADDLKASVSLGGVRHGVWKISDVRANKLQLVIDTRKEQNAARTEPEKKQTEVSRESHSDEQGFLDGLLPKRAEVSSLEVSSVDVELDTPGGSLDATDVAMTVSKGSSSDVFDVQLSGGTLNTSWFGSPLELQSAKGKYNDGHIYLTESRSGVFERGLLTLKGEVDDGRYAFYGTLSDVRSEEMVPEDWQKRVTGDLSARFKVRSIGDGARTRGELELKKGILTALPVLDRIAAYANTRRFRRLNLSEAELKFVKEGNRLELSDIVIASEGLVRVVGDLNIEGRRLDGRFRVGIVPGTLSHIPGAETKVFLRGEKGLLWSPLRITGTIDNPKEDLSNRMIAAAGERMFELVPETGKMALKFAHDTATELPSTAIDAGGKIIGEGSDVIEEGADIIREGVGGVLDLIPGSSGNDE